MGLDNALRVTFEALTHIGIQTRVSASIAGQGVVPTKASILVCTVADVLNRSFDDGQQLGKGARGSQGPGAEDVGEGTQIHLDHDATNTPHAFGATATIGGWGASPPITN